RVGEEILIMRALRCTVGDDKGSLAAAAGATTALRVVGRRWRYVAHVHDIHRRDVDAQLHGWRTEKRRQEAVIFTQLAQTVGVLGQFLAILGFESEATFS